MQDRHGAAVFPSGVVSVLVHRPQLLVEAALMWFHLVPRGWWHKAPYLPIPDSRWLQFRVETAFGDHVAGPDADALVEVLNWSRAFRHQVRFRSHGHR